MATSSGKMPHNTPNPSVVQSLDEMDFERGIWYPAAQGDLDRVCKLLNKGINVNSTDKSGYTALHYAVRSGDLSIVKTLINAGADVNVKTKAGQATPLHRAAAAGHAEVVKCLLDRGASLGAVDADGRTALHRAAEGNHEAAALLLLHASPPSLAIRDAKGHTPLELAKGSLATILKEQDNVKTTSPGSSKRSVSKSPRTRSVSPQ